MATTNTHAFNLDLNLLVEEAFERCGAELRTGYDLRTATRSLNLLTIEWANRGINLWTVEEGSIALVAGTATYNLPATTIDLMSQVIRTGTGTTQSDIAITRVSNPTYASIPSKNDTGRPIQIYLDRQAEIPTVTMWPIPNDASYTFVYWYLKRIDDAGTGVNTQHIPFRFLPCMVAGLAYYLSIKIPEAAPRIPMLKQEYEEQWLLASTEDREKATLVISPRTSYVQEIKMKEVPEDKKSSLGKLPTDVRNKMGFMKKGGSVKNYALSADDKRRRNELKKGSKTKSNMAGHKRLRKLRNYKDGGKVAADPKTTGETSLTKARESYNREKRARGGKSTKRFKEAEKAYINELESSIGSLKDKQSPPMPSRAKMMPDNRKILRQKRLGPDGKRGLLAMKEGGMVIVDRNYLKGK